MKSILKYGTLVMLLLATMACQQQEQPTGIFAQPERGFTSIQPAANWQHGLLTGNGTTGAIIRGEPYDETITLSHETLYLPYKKTESYMEMASHIREIQQLCLDGKFVEAAEMVPKIREEQSYPDIRDPFIAAFNLRIQQPADSAKRYQRSVDFMTAEACVSVENQQNSFQRSTFVSRSEDIIVVRLKGRKALSANFSFEGLVPGNEDERNIVAQGIKSSSQGVQDGMLYFSSLFAHTNAFNPNAGYEGVGKIITKGGTTRESEIGIAVADADEIMVLVRIRPILKKEHTSTNFEAMAAGLNNISPDYKQLLASHVRVHGDLMNRVSFSLDAPEVHRNLPSEALIALSGNTPNPLAMIERAFDAGRYNIICSTGANPPNLQGIWSATWLANWSGSFTTNGNLECAIAFNLMGNTPELMDAYFRFYDERWDAFRENARLFKGTRGFHVPAQLTVSPRSTNFTARHPHCFWHSGAAWACQFYYDYYQYTGDKQFLAERAYPIMKEAAEFYEDFLFKTGVNDKLAFVPSYSPENSPTAKNMSPVAINATMDISAAKQLLHNLVEAATILDRDAGFIDKWNSILSDLPDYEIAPDGSFREWLWPGLEENHAHRHASQLYALYDERHSEITDNPDLVKAIEQTIYRRFEHHKERPVMAFGLVQLGLASAHIGNSTLTQEIINFLSDGYWTTGMGSFHNRYDLFNVDISGGFPYLCASALVYADPGTIRFFPARPEQWKSGSVKGILLRGGITVKELTWNEKRATAILVSGIQQTVVVENSRGLKKEVALAAGAETEIEIE
ncbi:MAG: glycoside hydrolase N-terminal domain-containing protein [Bacteroidales bacterium]|nr:glycoside hydrolase N-terminal domain-containing protein [Bacteroidales bacterium]